jgi:hypothetical protein
MRYVPSPLPLPPLLLSSFILFLPYLYLSSLPLPLSFYSTHYCYLPQPRQFIYIHLGMLPTSFIVHFHFIFPTPSPVLRPRDHPLTPRFIAFIAGSFAAILLSASLIDPDLFLHFEITPHRTVLFYLGIFGTILAVSRGMVPEENLVFDPETTLREVVWWTHYLPNGWKGRLHSKMVRLILLTFIPPSFFSIPPSFFSVHAFPRSLSLTEVSKGHFNPTRHIPLLPISHIFSFMLSYHCLLSSSP